jgi:hypothetical protein
LAGAAGLAGFVYAVGGITLYFILRRAHIPTGEGLDHFSARRFIVVGVPVAIGVAVVALVATSLLRPTVTRVYQGHKDGVDRAAKFFWPKLSSAEHILVIGGGVVVALVAWWCVVWWFYPFELGVAKVYTKAGCTQGPYVSTDAQGVHLADGRHGQLQLIPLDDVIALSVSEKAVNVATTGITTCSA